MKKKGCFELWITNHISFRELTFPFLNSKQAVIAKKSLEPDPILKPDELSAHFEVEDNILKITLHSSSDRMIRIIANNFMDNIKTVIECLEDFDLGAQH